MRNIGQSVNSSYSEDEGMALVHFNGGEEHGLVSKRNDIKRSRGAITRSIQLGLFFSCMSVAEYARGYFKVKSTVSMLFGKDNVSPVALMFMTLALIPTEVGLKYHRSMGGINSLQCHSMPSLGLLRKRMLSIGSAAATLPALAEGCVFYYAMKSDYPAWMAAAFSVIAGLQCQLLHGGSLNEYLKAHAFIHDQAFLQSFSIQNKSKLLRYLSVVLVGLANLMAASGFAIPIYLFSQYFFHQWFVGVAQGSREYIGLCFVSGLLCFSHMGLKTCLQGGFVKKILYQFNVFKNQCVYLMMKIIREDVPYSTLLLRSFIILSFISAFVSSASSVNFLSTGFGLLFGSNENASWLIYLIASVMSLPIFLQNFADQFLYSLVLIDQGGSFWKLYHAAKYKLYARIGGGVSSLINKINRQEVLGFSYGRYCSVMLGIPISAAVVLISCAQSSNYVTKNAVLSSLAGATSTFFIQMISLDLVSFYHAGALRFQERFPRRFLLKEFLFILKMRAGLFACAVLVGAVSQYLFYSVLRHAMDKKESAVFNGQCAGALCQGVFSTISSLVLHHIYYPVSRLEERCKRSLEDTTGDHHERNESGLLLQPIHGADHLVSPRVSESSPLLTGVNQAEMRYSPR